MKIWHINETKSERFLARLDGRLHEVLSSGIESKVQGVVESIRRRGDKALVSLVNRHDLKGMEIADFRLQGQVGAGEAVAEEFVESVELALANLRAFHEPQVPRGYTLEREGGDLSVKYRPLESVGVYVPGGAAVYVSSLLMAVVPAQLAGVPRIAVATPPRAFLSSPHLRYLLDRLDLHEVYLMGGAHAIAALAYGTDSVAAVDKIVGPGGRWVTAAKRAVYGVVDLDTVAGPSEVAVVADGRAEPEIVAAELLAQAEHDADSVAVLVTTSRTLAEKVNRRITNRLRSVPKGAPVRDALRNWGAILLAADLDEAAAVVNRIAPEHAVLLVEDPLRLVDRIERAAAVYVGPWSSAVLGDYVVGTNHVLPTAGAARFSSPLGVADFVRWNAVVRVEAHGYPALARAATTLAETESLPLHAEALRAGSRGRR